MKNESIIEREGILALKEEYEKVLNNNLRNIGKKGESDLANFARQTIIDTLTIVVRDLEELLK